MPGLYMEPTIFADVEDGTFIAIEESFGPVMVSISKQNQKRNLKHLIYPQVVSKFAKDDVDGVLKRANDTEFGLASGVFTNDVSKVDSCSLPSLFANCLSFILLFF